MSEEFSPLLPSELKRRRPAKHTIKLEEDGLALLRKEVLSPIYGLDPQTVMAARSQEALLKLILPEKIVFFKNAWQEKAKTLCTIEDDLQEGMTPFYIMACWGHLEILKALIGIGKYTKQQFREAITTPLATGQNQGTTPLYVASFYGRYDILEQAQLSGAYTPTEWQKLMVQPLDSKSRDNGYTPFYAMASNGGAYELVVNDASLDASSLEDKIDSVQPTFELRPVEKSSQEEAFGRLYRMGGYTKSTWRDAVTTPLASGSAVGTTPLYIAAKCNHPGAIKSMRIYGEYSPDEWLAIISAPLTAGNEKGLAPIDIAALNGQEKALEEMLCGLTKGQLTHILNTRQVCFTNSAGRPQKKTLLKIVPERYKSVSEFKSEVHSRSSRSDSSSSSDSESVSSSGSSASTPPSGFSRLGVSGSLPSSGKNSPQSMSAASAYKNNGFLAEKAPVVLDLSGVTKSYGS